MKMWTQRLIHEINKPVLNVYFRFEFFIRELDNSLSRSLIVRFKRILIVTCYRADLQNIIKMIQN